MIAKPPKWVVLLVAVISCLWIVPVIGVVVTSIRPYEDIALGWWRTDNLRFTLDAWRRVWGEYPLAESFWMSFKLTAIATLATMFFAPAAAFAFQYLRFPFRRVLLVLVVNAFVLPIQVAIIPLFRLWLEFGMIDTMASVIIPFVGLSFGWSIFLVKSFLEDFPYELVEAGRIDGCGPIRVFRHIVLPNSLPAIMSVGILQFLWCWNTLLLPLLFLRTEVPLPVLLARVSGTYDPNWDIRSVAAIVTMAMPIIVFVLFQKHFVAGATGRSGTKG